uniref:Uncharacterized protein n=1 Tax=Toxoplasma gondii (strain ATCC 50861 / VEG) TaxID=432359 RepID=A0A0F7UZQ1_TOXGV|nr:TPA: hypothetical protein BN1205_075900 [Toxoplasma gondii VEG]
MEESTGPVNDCDNEDQHDSTAAPGERQVAQSLDTILEQHKTIQQETNAYLQNTVGRPLSLAIASLVKTQPLGYEKAAKVDSRGLTREDGEFLESLQLVDWMDEEVFQKILDYIGRALPVCACYVTRLHHDKDGQSPVLQYVYTDQNSRFLLDCMLLEDEGVLWDALSEPAEESEGGQNDEEQSAERGEEDDSDGAAEPEASAVEGRNHTELSENFTSRRIVKTLFVPDTMGEEKIRFWGMTRPGSFAAVPIIFDDPACKENVDRMKDYLLEVRERDKLIKEHIAARERARQEKEKSRQEASSADSRGRKGSTAASEHDNDQDEDEEDESEEAEEDEIPVPVAEPELVKRTVKMVLCVDTLGLQDALSPEQLKRLAQFAAVVKEQCIRTREAAVRKQAEIAVNDGKLKERSAQVEAALEEEENEVEEAVETERKRVAEELETKLRREHEDREARRQARLDTVAEEKRLRHEARQKQRAERQRIRQENSLRHTEREEHHPSVADMERRQGASAFLVNSETGTSEDANKWYERKPKNGNDYEHEKREHATEGALATAGDEDEVDFYNGVDEDDEDEDTETDGGDAGENAGAEEEEIHEPLDASVFFEEAEAKVKFQKATHTLVSKFGDILLEMREMFIPTVPSMISITAACLFLLGESPASLRVNSKVPDSSLDWQKIRSKIGPSLLLRIGNIDPTAARHTPPFQETVTRQDVALLQHIERLIEESSDGEERATDLPSPLFLLERWLALAVDYRRKHLVATAMTLYRDAKMNKRTLPKLEEVDPDFTGVSLDRVLAVWEEG